MRQKIALNINKESSTHLPLVHETSLAFGMNLRHGMRIQEVKGSSHLLVASSWLGALFAPAMHVNPFFALTKLAKRVSKDLKSLNPVLFLLLQLSQGCSKVTEFGGLKQLRTNPPASALSLALNSRSRKAYQELRNPQ